MQSTVKKKKRKGKDLVTIDKFASLSKVKPWTVYKYIRNASIKPVKTKSGMAIDLNRTPLIVKAKPGRKKVESYL